MAERGQEELTEVELLARIAEDLRSVKTYMQVWWWLFWIGAVLVFIAAASQNNA